MIKVKRLNDTQLEVIKTMLIDRIPLEEISSYVKGLNTSHIEVTGVMENEISDTLNTANPKRIDGALTTLLAKMNIKEEFHYDSGFWNGLTFEYLIEFIKIRNEKIYDVQNAKLLQRLFFSPSQARKTRHLVFAQFLNLLCTYEPESEDPFDLTWFVIDEYYEIFNIIYEKSYFKEPNTAKQFIRGFKAFVDDGNDVSSKDLQYVAKILSEASGVYYLDFFNEKDFYRLLEEELAT